jgi:hypothetical protein
MAEYLSGHPTIYMPTKEMHFFGGDLHFGRRFYRRDLWAYLAEYANWSGNGRAGDASVWYLFSREAAGEIKVFNPDSSIIIMLREPVEMLYSLYHQLRFDANEHLPTFEQALAAEAERRAGRRLCRGAYFVQGLAYREIANYTEQVRRYFEVFGRDRVRVITYDEFVSNPWETYHGTLEFLGVDTTYHPASFRVINGSKTVRSRILRAMLADPFVRSLAIAVSCRLGRRTFNALRSLESSLWTLNSRAMKRPPLSPQLRAQLKREFAPEVERLSALLGRDLTFWSLEERPVANGAHHRETNAERSAPLMVRCEETFESGERRTLA